MKPLTGRHLDEERLAGTDELFELCRRIGGAGPRYTAHATHEAVVRWIEDELSTIPGVEIRTDPFPVRRWQPDPDLERAAELHVDGQRVPVAGAVPYSAPVTGAGPLVFLPPEEPIDESNARGRLVVRDFPRFPVPYRFLVDGALHATPDLAAVRDDVWDRPGLADGPLHADLLAAGAAGAAGVVFAVDLPREQVAGYFEPHRGTHYAVPAAFVGAPQRALLEDAAGRSDVGDLAVRAMVDRAPTRNVHATLPGRTDERVVLVTHTDGNTWIQENGAAALLALARYFASVPVDQRRRTIELAFTSAHLHISREGSVRYAKELDAAYEDGDLAWVFPLEHLGARAVEPVPDGDDRRLQLTDDDELLMWAVGPSEPLRRAAVEAVERRGLRRTVVVPGLGVPDDARVPEYASFGGLGTPFHQHLVPTTSMITGPWSLWAPSFGSEAIDPELFRRQVLAAGDVVVATDDVPIDEIRDGYGTLRQARDRGVATAYDEEPPEVASGAPV